MNEHTILLRKPLVNGLLKIPLLTNFNIRVDLGEICGNDVNWIELAQNRSQWPDLCYRY
jgi:hypothetical protein